MSPKSALLPARGDKDGERADFHYLCLQGKNQEPLSSDHTRTPGSHSPSANRVSSCVLSRSGSGPALPYAATGEGQDELMTRGLAPAACSR